jgi:hypothetical protein
MKYVKLMILLVVSVFTFASADAQVRVSIGTGPYYWHGRHWHNRAPYWRHHHRYYRYY